jgi:hypothetical protein
LISLTIFYIISQSVRTTTLEAGCAYSWLAAGRGTVEGRRR